MSYATVAELAAYLGRSLTGLEVPAQLYLDAATAWIDRYTGRTWQTTSPHTEKHNILGNLLYLDSKPITAVTSVVVRSLESVNAADITLIDNVGYEVVDLERGLLNFGAQLDVGIYGPYAGYMATITYTLTEVVPANIKMATLILAGAQMNSTINPAQQRIRSYSDNRAISVTFKDGDSSVKEAVMWLPGKLLVIV